MSQRIISIDSQILNAIQKCARFTELCFVRRIAPTTKAPALEKGSLMHIMLDPYYSFKGDCLRPNPDWKAEVLAERVWDGIHPTDHDDIVKLCIDIGTYFASKMDIPTSDAHEVIFQFSEYTEHFRHDSWHPLAVEEVGAKVLHEDEDLKIIYNFKIDLIAEKGSLIAPWDHKTGARRMEPSSVSNQFIGYCFGLGLDHIVINKLGFQKTLSRSERFQRFTLQISPDRIEEWRQNTIYWVRMLLHSLDENQWPMNLTSCDKYSACIYRDRICGANPEIREDNILRDFKVAEEWDVANILEASE